MRPPVPTAPLPGMITTPGARALRRSCTLVTGACSTTSEASICETTLPMERRCCPPAVPVTTISSSSTAASESATRIPVSPTRTGRSTER